MRLPTNVAVALSGLYASITVIQTQLPLGKTLHIVLSAVLIVLAALTIHPQGDPASELVVAAQAPIDAPAPPAAPPRADTPPAPEAPPAAPPAAIAASLAPDPPAAQVTA